VTRRTAVLVAFLAASCAAPQQAPQPAPQPARVAPRPVEAQSSVDPTGAWEIRWDRTFARWQPPIFNGTLRLRREGAAWAGSISFRESQAKFSLRSLEVHGDRVEIEFQPERHGGALEVVAWVRDGRLVGEIRWDRIGWTPVAGRPLRKLQAATVSRSLPAAPLEGSGLDATRVAAMIDEAEAQQSSAVVLVRDGRIVVERYGDGYDGAPLVAMSASKSVVSLAVGLLVADGKLTLDTPVASLLPEWKRKPLAAITVRHLLTHTSGLAPERASFDKESIVERALASKLVFKPGRRFQYNNNAVDLLADIVRRAAGVPMDELLEARLFQKLEVEGARWKKDRAGTPLGAGELFIRPVDLAKIGQLMLDGGTWKGERLLPREWIDLSVGAGQSFTEDCGLLWWREGTFAHVVTEPLLAAWRDAGADAATLARARPLVGTRSPDADRHREALVAALGEPGLASLRLLLRKADHVPLQYRVSAGRIRGFSARGSLGQFLVVVPDAKLVAVRMRKPDGDDRGDGGDEKNGYPMFASDVIGLVAAPQP
jgi:CubicO group peptidase (beta-lactamase class C family)